MKTRVNVEEVLALEARLAEINKLNFDDIEWVENGEVVPTNETAEEWKFIGLCNTDFVYYGYYKQDAKNG